MRIIFFPRHFVFPSLRNFNWAKLYLKKKSFLSCMRNIVIISFPNHWNHNTQQIENWLNVNTVEFLYSRQLSVSEAFVRSCSVKKVFLEISPNSQENICARVSFWINLQTATLLKKRLWHRCFPVNFAKFLRTPFVTELFLWLLLSEENVSV